MTTALGAALSIVGVVGHRAVAYTLHTIDVPGGAATFAAGINDSGHVSGYYSDGTGNHGFVDIGGAFATFDAPGGVGATYARGINNAGQVTGSYYDGGADIWRGFVKTGGAFVTVTAPGASNTNVLGINDAGTLSGTATIADVNHGFMFAAGTFTIIDGPWGPTQMNFNNNLDQAVGYYSGLGQHGFLYSGGGFSTIDVPGASTTNVIGINDAGDLVGTYSDAGGNHGFVDIGGIFQTVDFPGALATYVLDISNHGQIVGQYVDGSGAHGFVSSSVPEPGTLALLGSGLLGLVAMRRRRAHPA